MEEKCWIALKDVKIFVTVCTTLEQLLECVIDYTYHSRATAMMGQCGLGNSTYKKFLDWLVMHLRIGVGTGLT